MGMTLKLGSCVFVSSDADFFWIFFVGIVTLTILVGKL